MDKSAVLEKVSLELGGRRVLSDCSLELERGHIHALVGPGGGGKTLVMKTLATLLEPNAGEVRLFGEVVDHLRLDTLKRFRRRIGVQFQNLALFDFMSVEENVAFPLEIIDLSLKPSHVRERVMSALDSVGLANSANLPVNSLSGGMQRRVAIARAIVTGADLILLDDPTGGLDPVTSSRIVALVQRVHEQKGNTVVVVSHDIDRLVGICSRFHVVQQGRVTFSGTIDEGRSHPNEDTRKFLDVSSVV